MKTFLNIRGTNGSGKTTLAKRFMGEYDATTGLNGYRDKKTHAHKFVTGVYNPERLAMVVGKYTEHGGGFDTLPTFEVQQAGVEAALALPDVELVVGEGILVSTVLGCWKPFAEKLRSQGHRVIWAFLDVPLEVCLRRLDQRRSSHGARKAPYKRDQIESKWRTHYRIWDRVKDATWVEAVKLPFEREWETLCELLGMEP